MEEATLALFLLLLGMAVLLWQMVRPERDLPPRVPPPRRPPDHPPTKQAKLTDRSHSKVNHR